METGDENIIKEDEEDTRNELYIEEREREEKRENERLICLGR